MAVNVGDLVATLRLDAGQFQAGVAGAGVAAETATPKIRSAGESADALGGAFELSNRRAATLVDVGLMQLGGSMQGLTALTHSLAQSSEAAAAAIGMLARSIIPLIAAWVGFKVGEGLGQLPSLISNFQQLGGAVDEFGNKLNLFQRLWTAIPENYAAFLEKQTAADKAWVDQRGKMQDMRLASAKAGNDAEAQGLAATLKGRGDEIAALAVERNAKLKDLDFEEAAAKKKLNDLTLLKEGRIASEREQAAIAAEFRAKRDAAEAEFQAQSSAAINKWKDERIAATAEVAKLEEQTFQARTKALEGELKERGDLAAAIRVHGDQELAAVRASSEEQLRAVEKAVREHTMTAQEGANVRVAIEQNASAQIVGILQKESAARNALVIGAPAYASAGNASAIAGGANAAIAATRAALAATGAVPQQAIGGGNLGDVAAQVATWSRYADAVQATAAAIAAYNLEVNRPVLGEGIKVVQDVLKEAEAQATSLAELRSEGVKETDVVEEQGRQTDALAAKFAALRVQYANTPAVIDQIDAAQRRLDYGGFALMVENATKKLADLPAAMNILERAAGPLGSAIDTLAARLSAWRGQVQGATQDQLALNAAIGAAPAEPAPAQ